MAEITGSVLCAIILSSSSPYITIPHSRPLSTTSLRVWMGFVNVGVIKNALRFP